jgi:tryptophan 2,3-dioxygenase
MNYWEYIRVEELLTLQGGIDRDESKVSNDETLFIVVHQIYELWFKLILRELTLARDIFQKRPVPDMELASATRSLKRVVVIFEQAVQHFKVMETLTTRDYLEFRDRLFHASGFQSAQLREIEIVLGLDDQARIPYGKTASYKDSLKGGVDGEMTPALRRVEARLASGPTLKTVLYEWLSRTPIEGSDNTESSNRFIDAFIKAYRSENRRRIRLASKDAPTPVDIDRLKERFEKDAAAAEAFLRAEDDPQADADKRAFLRRVRAGILFLESYRELPRLAWPREVVDTIIEMEQAMIVWRQRHARMVERVIGRRTGTGGSPGVDYLEQTAERYRIFSDLWTVRSLLLRKAKVPTIENTDEYRFRIED